MTEKPYPESNKNWQNQTLSTGREGGVLDLKGWKVHCRWQMSSGEETVHLKPKEVLALIAEVEGLREQLTWMGVKPCSGASGHGPLD